MPPTPDIVLNDFKALWERIGPSALDAIDRVGRSGWFILGTEVANFERELAAEHGVAHCVGCASGLDAIEIGLRAAGIGPGHEVLTTPMTAFATVLAILRAGADPRFADVDEFGLLDLSAVERELRQHPEIRAIVPVHLYGHTVDIPELSRIASEFDCVILEDAAQAILAESDGTPVGATTVGAATSFYPTKNLGALGDGGALLTNDADVAATARTLRDYGQVAKYEHAVAGLNSRLDEVQAAILRSAVLPNLRESLERRAAIAQRYRAIGNPKISIRIPRTPSTWHLFPVFTESEATRASLQEHLAGHGIQTAVHYPILASAQAAVPTPLPVDQFPVARTIAQTELSLPIHPLLSDVQIDRVVDACNAW